MWTRRTKRMTRKGKKIFRKETRRKARKEARTKDSKVTRWIHIPGSI